MIADFDRAFNPSIEEQIKDAETSLKIHNKAIEKKWCSTCRHWKAPSYNDLGGCDLGHAAYATPKCTDYELNEVNESLEHQRIIKELNRLKLEAIKNKTKKENDIKEDCYFYGEDHDMGAKIRFCTYDKVEFGVCPCAGCDHYLKKSDSDKLIREQIMSKKVDKNETSEIMFLPVCKKCLKIIWEKVNIQESPRVFCGKVQLIGFDYDITPFRCPNCNAIIKSIAIPTKLPFNASEYRL